MPPQTDPNSTDHTNALDKAADSVEEPDDPFEALVFAALDSQPEVFRERLGSVAVVVEDEPTPDQLGSVGAWGLLGLYTGVPRTAWGAEDAAVPSKITIFRGPHLRQFGDPVSLALGVADTVRHEVAHHFGISDARLDELARRRQGR
jgi:predicted Zn-dependent protease with MMP-like domain